MLIIYLFGENEISEHCHGGAIGHEIGDRFHDIPGVVPPSQAGQKPKLDPHSCQSRPRQKRGSPLSHSIQLVHFLKLSNQKYYMYNIYNIIIQVQLGMYR